MLLAARAEDVLVRLDAASSALLGCLAQPTVKSDRLRTLWRPSRPNRFWAVHYRQLFYMLRWAPTFTLGEDPRQWNTSAVPDIQLMQQNAQQVANSSLNDSSIFAPWFDSQLTKPASQSARRHMLI